MLCLASRLTHINDLLVSLLVYGSGTQIATVYSVTPQDSVFLVVKLFSAGSIW